MAGEHHWTVNAKLFLQATADLWSSHVDQNANMLLSIVCVTSIIWALGLFRSNFKIAECLNVPDIV